MGKGSSARHYEDFQVGLRLECAGPRTLSEADRAAWVGFTGDPVPRYATGRAVHPLLVLTFVHGQMMRELNAEVHEALGCTSMVMHRPVGVGATLRTTARVIGLREDPDQQTGVVWVRAAGRDVRGVVLSYVTWFRVAKKHRQSQHARDALPNLTDKVPMSEIMTRDLVATPRHETGGRFSFEDYVLHESIHHRGSTSVAPGDVQRFARWFREDSPRHHDTRHPHYAAPLTQCVGLAYALAHDGIEDRIGIGAVNALRQPNPLREGDQLTALSQVAALHPVDARLGAVRFRLFLFRGYDATKDDKPRITEGKRYHDHVALDMDYWELIPTQVGLR